MTVELGVSGTKNGGGGFAVHSTKASKEPTLLTFSE
jgi:hypothetical protein